VNSIEAVTVGGLAALGLLLAAPALASPAWPIEELLHRSDQVLVGSVKADGKTVEVATTRWLRGKGPAALHFTLASDSSPLPAECLFISQGDARGTPTNEVRFDQDIKGQAGYRGWLAFRLERRPDGHLLVLGLHHQTKAGLSIEPVPLEDLQAIVDRAPASPGRGGRPE
jgi:hypothetical protein